jgi:DNA-binding NarL/FixJ family response regulator
MLAEEYRDVIIAEARTGAEGLSMIRKQPWDLAVLDLSAPGNDRFFVLQQTLLRRPATRVLMLTADADAHHAARALQMGAAGCVRHNAERSELVKAFKNVIGGKTYYDQVPPKKPTQQSWVPNGHESLSVREHKVLLAVAAGKRTGEIAADWNLSVKSVSTYKTRVLRKLGLKTTADMVRYVTNERLS